VVDRDSWKVEDKKRYHLSLAKMIIEIDFFGVPVVVLFVDREG
jgi:hypothetical protein